MTAAMMPCSALTLAAAPVYMAGLAVMVIIGVVAFIIMVEVIMVEEHEVFIITDTVEVPGMAELVMSVAPATLVIEVNVAGTVVVDMSAAVVAGAEVETVAPRDAPQMDWPKAMAASTSDAEQVCKMVVVNALINAVELQMQLVSLRLQPEDVKAAAASS